MHYNFELKEQFPFSWQQDQIEHQESYGISRYSIGLESYSSLEIRFWLEITYTIAKYVYITKLGFHYIQFDLQNFPDFFPFKDQ